MDCYHFTADASRKVAFTAARLQEGRLHNALPHVKSLYKGGIPEEHISEFTPLGLPNYFLGDLNDSPTHYVSV